jgi:hypothetical protein
MNASPPQPSFCAVTTASAFSMFTFNLEVSAMSQHQATITPAAMKIVVDANSPQRWTTKRKAALFIDILQSQITAAKTTCQHSLTLAEIGSWSRTP